MLVDTATSLHHALQKPRTQPQYQDIDELHSSESNLYADLFKHSSAGVRISAYELLITSTETTKPMKSSTLSLLSSCLVYLQGDTDPGHRSEINNIIRSMIDRLRRGSALYARNLAKVESTNQQCRDHEHELEQHDKFLSWFINFLEDELGPGCSFSRHISALKAFQMLVESGLDPKIPKMMAHRSSQDLASWPYKKSLSHNTMKSALWQLLLDPFEEVRVTTAFVLNLLLQNDGVAINPCENNALGNEVTGIEVDDAQSAASDETDPPNFGLIGDIASLLEAANRLAAITNRADHADGVGRLLGFQYRLARSPSLLVSSVMERIENVICVSAGKTSLPAKDFSLHGYLLGLKYIIEGFPASESSTSGIIQTETNVHVDRLYNLCESVWRAVRSDLCVDSPEFSHDIDATGPYGGPKDFLSYSWRALRDSSLLMQAILQHLCPLKDEERLLVGRAQLLRSTYTLCFEQLTALRHRGAFSTVAQTFGLCCEQFATIPSLQAELQGHYQVRPPLICSGSAQRNLLLIRTDHMQEAFHVLTDQSSKLTRRSAGLPAILAGLLNPSPTEDFNEVIESLVSLARRQNSASSFTGKDQETQLPQVHALNCLREIFTNSKFRIRTATWLIEALSLAASSLSSRTWAIRNCGLMLFRACANRMDSASEVSALGTNDTPSPNQSRIMLNIAFELLDPKEEIASGSSELVLAGLDLISRISIPENDRLQTRRKILAQLGRHVWIVREHASRVYAAQLPASETLEAATHLISSITLSDQNRSHGILLCARELLNRHVGYPLPFSDAETLELQEVLQCHTPSIMRCASPAVRCALLDILNDWPALQRAPRVTAHGTFSLDSPYSDPELPTVIRGELSDNHEIPFPSQLRGSLALGACLAILAGDPQATYTLLQVCKEVAANDLDAAAVLLQAVLEHGSRNRFTLQLLAEFYMAVIHNNYAEDITAIAMTGLSACLEQCLENSDLGAPMLRLECLFDDIVELPHNRGRDLFTATLRVLGSMLAYSSSMMHSVWDHRSSVQLKYWVAMLNGAAKDGTDALTRLNAARALHCFRHCLLQECDRIGVQKKIHLYSLLYDFLNDDDEEIRALAASTTSYILSAAAGGVNLQLSSLASCHQLSAFMAKSFSSKDEFHLLALSRIMLPTAIVFDELTSFAAIVSHHSVRVQLNFARQESHDLFEEERQNLYLDDVSEIETWHLALGKVAPSWIDDDVRELVEEWALNGVRELAIALPGLSHGPFGTLSKIKMLTLFLRVIQTTDLCLEWFFSSDFGFGPPQDSVHLIEMEQLLSVARECPIHPRAQKLLEQSVGRGRLGCHQMRLMAET